MAGKLRNDSDGINEINITPFVDVALVLLIVVMLAAPAIVAKGMKVALPSAVKVVDIGHVTLAVAIDAEGKMSLDGKPVTPEQLTAACRDLKAYKVRGDALIAADRKTPHGDVLMVVDLLRAAGIEDVGFNVRQRPASGLAE